LSPFEEATNALQGDGITISSVIPALLGIDDMIASCNYEQFITLGQRLRQALHDRFQHVITRDEYVLATVLDCRYKLIPFADNSDSEHLTSTSNATLQPCSKREAMRRLADVVERAKRTR